MSGAEDCTLACTEGHTYDVECVLYVAPVVHGSACNDGLPMPDDRTYECHGECMTAPPPAATPWAERAHRDPYCATHCREGSRHSQCGCPCDHREPATTPSPEPAGPGPWCFDCGLPYAGPGWCDVRIPDAMWLLISPTDTDAGFLCLTCITRRLQQAGIDDVPLTIMSGPWAATGRNYDAPAPGVSGETREAAQRVAHFVAEWKKHRGHDPEQVHGLNAGTDREAVLLASDLLTLAALAPGPDDQMARAIRTLLPGLRVANYRERWANGSPAVQEPDE